MNSWIPSTRDSGAETPVAGPTPRRAGAALKSHTSSGARRLIRPIIFSALSAFVFCQSAPARAETKQLGLNPFCNAPVHEGDTRSLEQSQITRLGVVISNGRKWAKNNLKILRTRSNSILPKHKKRFDGIITARFSNGLTCKFKARVRQSGDLKEHIQFTGGNVINSLDVKLLEGHLNGVVRFKLLIPHTRGGTNEVILANLLRAAGFLAPKTALLKVNVMGHSTELLFQEKQRKEMLEDNNFREGPILEGDERFAWIKSEVGPGTLEIKRRAKLFDDSMVFSRITNNNWAAKGANSVEISKEAVRKLNNGYLKSGYLVHIKKGGRDKPTYFDNNILADGDRSQLQHLNAFNAILQASNAPHALRPHNRIFYYDPMYGYFHPMYYDGNATFGKFRDRRGRFYLGPSKFAVDGALGAKKTIERINSQDFLTTLRKAGLDVKKSDVVSILKTLGDNLSFISKLKHEDYSSVMPPSPVEYIAAIQKKRKDDITLVYFSTQKSADTCDQGLCPAKACDLLLKSCRPIKLDLEESGELLSGKMKIRKKPTLFQDLSRDSAPVFGRNNQTQLTPAIATNVDLITSPGMKVTQDAAARTITFHQETNSEWALLRGGSLDGVSIRFAGKPKTSGAPSGGQRFNNRLLTGCLSLVDMTVNKLNVVVDGGGCEDGLNLVRVNGQIGSIKVSNAAADAVDIDFSRLSVDEIIVENAGNDCLDVSAGTYAVKSIQARNCGDKGISVGEGSRLNVDHALIETAHTGVAVKDSSRFSAMRLQVRKAKMCISAYRKKQEFSGGIARIAESICNGAGIHADLGSAVLTRATP